MTFPVAYVWGVAGSGMSEGEPSDWGLHGAVVLDVDVGLSTVSILTVAVPPEEDLLELGPKDCLALVVSKHDSSTGHMLAMGLTLEDGPVSWLFDRTNAPSPCLHIGSGLVPNGRDPNRHPVSGAQSAHALWCDHTIASISDGRRTRVVKSSGFVVFQSGSAFDSRPFLNRADGSTVEW